MSKLTMSIKAVAAALVVTGSVSLAVKGVLATGGAASSGHGLADVGALAGAVVADHDDRLAYAAPGGVSLSPYLYSDTKTLTITGTYADDALEFIQSTSISSGLKLAEHLADGRFEPRDDLFAVREMEVGATSPWVVKKAGALAGAGHARTSALSPALMNGGSTAAAGVRQLSNAVIADVAGDLQVSGRTADYLAINDSWTSLNGPVLVFGAKMIALGYERGLMSALAKVDATVTLAEGLTTPTEDAYVVEDSAEIPTCIPGGPFIEYITIEYPSGDTAPGEVGTADYSGHHGAPPPSASCEGQAYQAQCDDCGDTTATNDAGLSYNQALNALEAHMEDVLELEDGDIAGEWWGWFEDADGTASDDTKDLTARLVYALLARNTASVIYCSASSSDRDEGAVVYAMEVKRAGSTSWSELERSADPERGDGYDIDSAEDWARDAGVTLTAISMTIRDYKGNRTLTGDQLTSFLSTCTESLIDP